MNRFIGYYFVDIDDGELRFKDPEKLLHEMGDIRHKKIVFHHITHPLALNIDCHSTTNLALSVQCELIKKQPLYVIYSPDEEKANLYLAPSFFKKPGNKDALDFIPNSTTDWSYLNTLGTAGSFSNDADYYLSKIFNDLPNYYNLYSNNIISYKNSSVIANISDNQGIIGGQYFQIPNLYAQHFIEDKQFKGGYLTNINTPFIQTQTILGLSVNSTLETVKNFDDIAATPLVIFVPQASQISIFKNDQLIYSQFLEAGFQRINTSGFPDGGYELLVKIGNDTLLRRFFSKGLHLPPQAASQYYVTAGYLTNGMIFNYNQYNYLPNVLNIPMLQAGINKRLGERWALSTDVLLRARQGLIDMGPAFFLKNMYIKTAALLTTGGNYGLYAMLNAQKNRVNFNALATKIVYQSNRPVYFFLNNLEDNDSVSLSYLVSEKDIVGIQANYSRILEDGYSYSAGGFYQRLIGNYKNFNFFLNASYNKTLFVGDIYNVGLSMNFIRGKLSGSEALLWQNQSQNSSPGCCNNQAALPIVNQGSTNYSNQNEQGHGHALNEIHTLSPTANAFAGTYNYINPHAFIAVYGNYSGEKGNNSTLGYGGNLETQMAVKRGSIRFNGVDRASMAGLMVGVKTSDPVDDNSEFAVVDGLNRKIAIIPANKKVFISRRYFDDSNYTLINLSKGDYAIKEASRHVTLYPGNIASLEWSAEKRIIVIGRVVSNHHQPRANSWIHTGRNGIFSDGEGYFQLELSKNTRTLTVDDSCQIFLPNLNIHQNYLYLGELTCS